nr:alpha/beta hydrolase [Flavipsychrobacter sp. JY13-12]
MKELRPKHPANNKGLARLTLKELKQHYANIIRSQPEKPIVIGHSFGGMLTQLMLNNDLAAAAVAIHSVPPMGVLPYEFSFLKSVWKSLGLFTSLDETYLMSFKDWQYAFVNDLPLDIQKAAYEALTIPESKVVSRGALTSEGKVDFSKPHAPLLMIAGEKDHITPVHLNKRNFHAYHTPGSVVDFKLYPNHNHFVLGLPDWRDVATYVHDWLN